jgi:hypothetical protein
MGLIRQCLDPLYLTLDLRAVQRDFDQPDANVRPRGANIVNVYLSFPFGDPD